ncbi:MAG: putative efflux system component YknX [bacterium ADurb.Bin429]|nr:MAG: putative efflux system component YknX [bacterium ADurb.Bin429]
MAQARAQAEQANKDLARAQMLFQRGAIPAQQLDAAQAAARTAAAQLEAQQQVLAKLEAGPRPEDIAPARARLREAEAGVRAARAALGQEAARAREVEVARANADEARAALRGARDQLDYTMIRSPLAGIVARKHQEVGEIATPYAPIISIADLAKIWVTAEVDAEDVAAVTPGQQVIITLDAYPGRRTEGTVTRVSAIAEPKDVGRVRAKVVRARIRLLSIGFPLRPGMEVNVTGTRPAGAATLLVPNDAVLRTGDQDQVYVVRDGRARLRAVRTGQFNFDQTQILDGLTEGEQVAVSALDQLRDGARVRATSETP